MGTPQGSDKETERKHTDASLREERNRTDHELVTRSETLGETADDVIRMARERAQAVLESARSREDLHAPVTPEQLLEREHQDALLASEYEAADLALRDERTRRRLAVRQLLALERRATDATLMLERTMVDDTMVERATVDLIVHDLRSMLSAISINAATIVVAADKNQPVQLFVDLANHIQRAIAQSDLLLGDLQELATMEDGKSRLHKTDADLCQIVRTAVEINQAAATANQHTLNAQVPAEPCMRSVDAPRLMRVINNLITNAIKFTPAGGTITVSVTHGPDGTEVAVSDTGPGIPPELHELVFERFRQGRDARGRGVGLGLYIARAIVDAHGGRIWVDSPPGGGATFRIRLP